MVVVVSPGLVILILACIVFPPLVPAILALLVILFILNILIRWVSNATFDMRWERYWRKQAEAERKRKLQQARWNEECRLYQQRVQEAAKLPLDSGLWAGSGAFLVFGLTLVLIMLVLVHTV